MALQPPVLSVFDPPESSEGSIDPLSLQATYENLAERIYPYITVRMSRPRFFTAMVVGSHICSEFIDELAEGEVTPAWLAFEWHVVEAFVRCGKTGIPGVQKVQSALSAGKRVGPATYLKTPKVFGFSGVYKRLARGLQILNDAFELDEGGFELLTTWEKEQRLQGFWADSRGPGAELRDELRQAVRESMRKGYVTRGAGWPYWEILTRHLRPDGAQKKEAECIAQRLFHTEGHHHTGDPLGEQMRRQMLEHLQAHGKPVWREGETVFFRTVMRKASPELRERLEGIDAYEGVCRIADDAFRLILHLSTTRGAAPVGEKDFAAHRLVSRLLERLPRAVIRLERQAINMGWTAAIPQLVHRYSSARTPGELFHRVLEHHEEAQRSKPPDGKRPWVEYHRGGVVVRPLYQHPNPPQGDDSYVYDYRTASVSRFLVDLKRIGT